MIDDDAYNALRAAQIYVFAAVSSAARMAEIADGLPSLTAGEVATARRLLKISQADLDKIDRIVAREAGERL